MLRPPRFSKTVPSFPILQWDLGYQRIDDVLSVGRQSNLYSHPFCTCCRSYLASMLVLCIPVLGTHLSCFAPSNLRASRMFSPSSLECHSTWVIVFRTQRLYCKGRSSMAPGTYRCCNVVAINDHPPWSAWCLQSCATPHHGSSLADLRCIPSNVEKDHQWRSWAAREIQQRALLAYCILDGLVAQMSGDGASTRHVANPLILPSGEAALGANNADEWLAYIHSQKAEQPSLRLVFGSLFPPIGSLSPLDYQFSAFALRAVLEGIQSFVSDLDNSDLAAVGVLGRSDVRRALVQVHETITMRIHLSSPERLEVLLRWHTICLDAMVNSTMLCRHVCSRYNIPKEVSGGSRALKSGFDMVKWVNTEGARRALLHAIAIQDIIEQLPRGCAHVIHMPSSLFAAATIYVAFSLAGIANIHLPRTVV
ncbi:C2H2 type zinc finger domain protein [Aspergillus clavatus NRRL 1]|uniref:Transcription factor domain-containing protein n=1 Tax=Aspergillus clavatus (strain ATCC 1007 / CBS 513.65 / DSM 816 / NCTC 3887 / NRRL 1 / QM 1276 / 107) TaxID=344612 RepID=A1CS48_ASPCL|nr:uncharacterized protein ACLA_032040 [Aspergillus clavatus NRRL 1]EAW08469.1 conserved hypothetical protein [Aspergillus clavatus NRRL 1]